MIEGNSRKKINIHTKYIIIFLIALLCTVLVTISMVACNTEVRKENDDIFTIISHDEKLHCYIVYMNKTKVMYTVSDGNSSRGIFTVLVNEDGTPMKYKGE